MDIYEESLELHRKLKGKLEIKSKFPIKTKEDLSLAYTPGVAESARKIAEDKSKVYDYTPKGNLVAVVSNGTAVLGLGNIGAEAAIPVMEGKAILFKEFAGIDAFPICLKNQDIKQTIETIKNISPVFGGIKLEEVKIVINGSGAAGIAVTKLMLKYGFKNIIVLDTEGIIYEWRKNLNKTKEE